MSPDNPDLEEKAEDDSPIAIQLSNTSRASRRKFIGTSAAVWATASLAGCGGNGGDAATDTETTTAATDTPTATETDEPTTTTEPAPQNFVVADDMAAGSEGIPQGAAFVSACSPTRKFVPGMHAIWHVGVYDPETGDQLTDDDLEAVNVEFLNRGWDPAELTWAGDAEENASDEWNGSLTIPQGAETGTVQYKITITDGDANYRDVGIMANEFEIIEYDDPVTYVVSNYTYAISSPDASNGFVSACGPEWQYMPGMTVAFAANIYEAETGKEPGPDTIDAVTVTFPNGEFDDIDLAWQGDAEEHAEKVWDGSLDLPSDVATGTYEYEIQLTVDADNVYDAGIATDTFTVINPSG
jgi:hypothetical protein